MTNPIKMLGLSLTGRCNYKCIYCYAQDHCQAEMSYEIAAQALSLAAGPTEDNSFVVQFTGGEPLLAFPLLKKIVSLVEHKHYKARLQIQTNGSLVTDDIARYLFKHKIAIGVSLDGRPQVNNKTRKLANGEGASNATLRGITVLRNNNIGIGITCVVSDENVRELPGIVEMTYYLGNVRKIGFDLLRGQGSGGNLLPASARDVRMAVQATYALSDKMRTLTKQSIEFSQIHNVKVVESCGEQYHFGHCYAMNGNAAFVDAKGDIYACSSLIGNPDFYLGTVEQGIDAQKLQKVQATIQAAMNFCTNCPDFNSCGGGCFARWYGTGKKKAYEAECSLKRLSIAWAHENRK